MKKKYQEMHTCSSGYSDRRIAGYYFDATASVVQYPESRDMIWHRIDSLGPWGIAALLIIQVLQVVIAFIPGEPVELAAGLLYGTWGGLLISLAGVLIGSSLIFAVVRQFGRPLVHRLVDRDSFQKYAFLSDARKLDTFDLPHVSDARHPQRHLELPLPSSCPISPARFLVLSAFAHPLHYFLHLCRSNLC